MEAFEGGERQNIFLLELFEMVRCNKYKMGTRQHCKGHQKLKREAGAPSQMTLIISVECMSPV